MRLLTGSLLLAMVAGCSVPATTPAPEPTPAVTTPAASASSAAGIERLCEAFDIVQGEVSTAYDELATGPGDDVALSLAGLAILTAGADIEALADGVERVQLAAAIREMGRRYQDEGEAVADGNLGGMAATSYYLDLLERYGQECR